MILVVTDHAISVIFINSIGLFLNYTLYDYMSYTTYETYIYVHMYICIFDMYIFILQKCVYTYVQIHTYIYICVCIHLYMYEAGRTASLPSLRSVGMESVAAPRGSQQKENARLTMELQ